MQRVGSQGGGQRLVERQAEQQSACYVGNLETVGCEIILREDGGRPQLAGGCQGFLPSGRQVGQIAALGILYPAFAVVEVEVEARHRPKAVRVSNVMASCHYRSGPIKRIYSASGFP